MGEAWSPPERSHYEHAEAALSAVRNPDGLGSIPTDPDLRWTYGVALTMTLAGAVVHALLALTDSAREVGDDLVRAMVKP